MQTEMDFVFIVTLLEQTWIRSEHLTSSVQVAEATKLWWIVMRKSENLSPGLNVG